MPFSLYLGRSMKATTIDQLPITANVRWAEDQRDLDISFVTEPAMIAPHPEIVGLSIIYPSKFDILFDLQKRNIAWASFEPPKRFHLFRKRHFSRRLFASFDWDEEEEDSIPGERLQQVMERLSYLPPSLFEKDKTTLISLLQSLRWINTLVIQIQSRKLQYQRG
jgi:hypothetical protein